MLSLNWLQLENCAALYNFASIATAADGLILSRGNLGLDVAPEKMALVQKSVVSRCNLLGKPVIITRVVDTMATAPRPTRSLLLSCIRQLIFVLRLSMFSSELACWLNVLSFARA